MPMEVRVRRQVIRLAGRELNGTCLPIYPQVLDDPG